MRRIINVRLPQATQNPNLNNLWRIVLNNQNQIVEIQPMEIVNDEIEGEIKDHKKFIDHSVHNSKEYLSISEYSKKKKYYSEDYDKNKQNLRNKQEKLKTLAWLTF